MSLADLDVAGSGPSEDFGRTPPQDVAAEQSVLGGMLLSKDAIADVVEVLRGPDFYRPAHELIFEAILDLYGRGEPADAVTVADELTKRGDLSRVGGPAYLHTLLSSVPTAANAGFYARIVHERAVLRRLVSAGTKIVQLGYATDGGDVDEIVNAAQAEIYKVTERRTTEDYAALGDIIEGAIDEIEASSSRGDGLTGVPTGFADLDRLTNGLHPGQMIVIAARPAMGKALALGTPIPTPGGWTTMGRIVPGDVVLGDDGRPTEVTAVTEVMTGRPCYEVEFSDGSVIVADGEHLWLTTAEVPGSPGSCPPPAVRTTAAMAAAMAAALTAAAPGRAPVFGVRNPEAVRLPVRDLPIGPYTLGAWLGAGSPAEFPAAATARAEGERRGAGPRLAARLDALGLLREPYLPVGYLRASVAQRRALLAGLLDTGAAVSGDGSIRFTTRSAHLAGQVRELLSSLGLSSELTGSPGSPGAYDVVLVTDDAVFGLEHLTLLHKERRRASPPGPAGDGAVRFITGIRPVPSVPVRCIQVANASHLYLAGPTMIPTHNSTVALDIARSAAIHHSMTTVIFSLEMGKNEIVMRLLSAEARIPLQNMRKGTMREEDWTRLARTMGDISEAPLYIDDSPNMSLMEIRAKCRRLKQRQDLKLVVIDYLQLMSSGKKVESRQQEVSEFSRALKLLAKELGVPVIALSQLNRGPEQRTDKKPQMSDLRESGSIEQDADMIILLHREDVYEKESPRAGEADFIVAKHRNGPTDTIVVAFQGHYSRFVDMAT